MLDRGSSMDVPRIQAPGGDWVATDHAGIILAAVAGAILALGSAARGDEPVSRQDAAAKDYAGELPRTLARAPAEAQKAFVARPGFRVELAAAEPLVKSPVAIDFDEHLRLYVAEYPEYNEYAGTRPHGKGCVRRLEDINGDGVYD